MVLQQERHEACRHRQLQNYDEKSKQERAMVEPGDTWAQLYDYAARLMFLLINCVNLSDWLVVLRL